ncbi:uncharacterized protein A4U43_C07F29050 [Asparagus officinalis]|uniref:Uncharacterized protein n=1 Tax=Asparagus officinalis TaxID=4686 RepID=A0A5P1EFN6_ASPOF|nr:uncharacterized protein A4U43_C07F29050 [Asparagus officinalis]
MFRELLRIERCIEGWEVSRGEERKQRQRRKSRVCSGEEKAQFWGRRDWRRDLTEMESDSGGVGEVAVEEAALVGELWLRRRWSERRWRPLRWGKVEGCGRPVKSRHRQKCRGVRQRTICRGGELRLGGGARCMKERAGEKKGVFARSGREVARRVGGCPTTSGRERLEAEAASRLGW